MALTRPPIDSDAVSEAMIDGLMSRIRSELRARILERIEPDIASAVDVAAEKFLIAVKAYHEPHEMMTTVRVLIDRRDKAPSD
jgi:hypothetical protein